ncbi:Na+/H+ antiporter NhaC family protein [Proteinivorax hydrogeniformans]|uniref:Na+/H+ antiporter NhaC family protein n=1 Tax=Proteinivorax hydrogeniformans TaxID=1826727 RepID=A0AAU8HW07_9FIRM
MENSILVLLPPVIAIVMAIITKQVIFSLGSGIIIGGLMLNGFNPLSTLEYLSTTLMESVADPKWNTPIIVFCLLLGGIIGMVSRSKATISFSHWAAKRVKTRRGAMLTTWILGMLMFIDDYFNSLSVGAVMRPITDKMNVSREKLAYILDSTAAPVCIIAPVSTWIAFVMSIMAEEFTRYGIDKNPFSAFISIIPFNFYAILALVMVVFIAIVGKDFGPMKRAEEMQSRATSVKQEEISSNSTVWDLVIPIGSLVFMTLLAMIWTGGYFTADISLWVAFTESDPAFSLIYGGLIAVVITFAMYAIKRTLPFGEIFESFVDGMKTMMGVIVVLALAWTIGAVIGDLNVRTYIADIVADGSIPMFLIPVTMFLISALVAFSTGSSWGTFSIMVPIAIATAVAGPTSFIYAALGAVLGGAVLGDHCSPISDSTILSSAGADCSHIDHVNTQLPYALVPGGFALIGSIMVGVGINHYIVLTLCIAAMLGFLHVILNKN